MTQFPMKQRFVVNYYDTDTEIISRKNVRAEFSFMIFVKISAYKLSERGNDI